MGSDPENFSHLFRTSRQLRKTQQSMVPTGISTCQSREEAIKNECLYSPYRYNASILTLPNLVENNMTSWLVLMKKKCILKSSLPGMYWNVWVLWCSWQDWWLKIWIYIGTKKLLISPFASSSNQTYSLCPETKTVKGKCCYSYCCLRHKKHGLVKLYNNTYSFTMSTEEFIHSKTCLNWHLHIQIHKM